MTLLWSSIEKCLNLFMPSEWDLWQSLMVIGVCFGVVVWWCKK